MSRALVVLTLAILILIVSPPAARSADEEPMLLGRKLSEWLKLLREDKEAIRRQYILRALEVVGPNAKDVLPAIRTSLKEDTDEGVRTAAAQTLGRMAPKAKDVAAIIEALVGALQDDKSGKVREAAAGSLGSMAADKELRTALPMLARLALPPLTKALKDMHAGTRAAATEAVGRFGPDAREALPSLVEVLKDKKANALTRELAIRSLLTVGAADDHPTIVAALIESLGDLDASPDVRKASADGLGRLGKNAGSAVPALGQSLKDKDAFVRRAAALALEKIGPEAKDVLPALQKALQDEDRFVRSQALHTIGSLGKEAASALPAIFECLKDPVIEVRLAAIAVLGVLGTKDDKAVIDALTAASQEGQNIVREAAKDALKKILGDQ